jgi:hypothetical protein
MLFKTRHIAVLASISILANALPFDVPRQVVQRQKNYSVINVDGGSSPSTKTAEVVNPVPAVTQKVTTTAILSVAPKPTPTSSCSESTTSAPSSTITSTSAATSSTSIAIETPKPVFVTITVSKDGGPTEYYDNGLWHTSYRVKAFEAAVATMVPSASIATTFSSTAAPILETSAPAYNQTSFQQYE